MARDRLCTHCKCAAPASPLSLDIMDDLMALFSKEVGTVEGSEERYLLHRPDLWEPGTEVVFPDGLFGRRITGVISRGGSSPYDIEIPMTKSIQMVNVGGAVYITASNKTNISASAYGADSAVVSVRFNGTTNKLVIRTLTVESRDNAPYDIWITYR